MSTMSGRRIADLVHKTAVTGIFATFLYVGVGVTGQLYEGVSGNKSEKEHPQAGFIQTIKAKAEEEYRKYYDIDKREWYNKDVSSFLHVLEQNVFYYSVF
jgi:hypothetical protein